MYIRSQDKMLLIPINNLVINIDYRNENEIIVSSPINIDINDFYSVGTYNSKDRAISVLDEIQTAIELFNTSTKSLDLSNYNNGVYNMPNY